MRKKIYLVSGLLSLSALAANAQVVMDSLVFTGSMQTFTVPCGVNSVQIQAYGAQGATGAVGGNSSAGGAGGLGGYATGILSVTPGQVLNIFVGGQGAVPAGGFNGGANGGSQNAGGGGGASDVRVNGTALTDRVLTAGGGGGGGRGGCELNSVTGGSGGVGGGGNGANGTDAATPNSNPTGFAGGGQGGQGTTGGLKGTGCSGFLGVDGASGTSGIGGIGGDGQSCCCFSAGSIPGGGGGGGGFMGGGGGGGGSAGTTGCSGNDKGGGGGGAGGTNDVSGVTSGAVATGVRVGNGAVYLIYTLPTPGNVTVSGNGAMCNNSTASITCSTDPFATQYVWTVPSGLTLNSGQNTNSINFTANTAGTYTITVQPVNGNCSLNGPVTNFVLTVNAPPTVVLNTPATACVTDGPVALTGGAPSGGTYSGTGVTGSSFSPSTAGAGTHVITYTFTDGNGCQASDTSSITVDACAGLADNPAFASVQLMPNPVSDLLQVRWDAAKLNVIRMEITDVNGRIILSENVNGGNTASMKVLDLPAGNYNLVMSTATSKGTLRFVKK